MSEENLKQQSEENNQKLKGLTKLSENETKEQNKDIMDTDTLLERARRLLNKNCANKHVVGVVCIN